MFRAQSAERQYSTYPSRLEPFRARCKRAWRDTSFSESQPRCLEALSDMLSKAASSTLMRSRSSKMSLVMCVSSFSLENGHLTRGYSLIFCSDEVVAVSTAFPV